MEQFLTVSQISRELGLSTRMLRYYEKIGLVQSQRKEGYAYRIYDEEAVARLRQIVVLRKLRIPLKQIDRIFQDPQASTALEILQENLRNLEEETASLSAVREVLQKFVEALKERAYLPAPTVLLKDDNLQKLIHSLSPVKNQFQEERVSDMEKLNQAEENLSKLKDVRIIHIPPATVAAAHFIGEEPENQVGKWISDFARQSRIWEIYPQVRLFGFNAPNPVDETGCHGYEMWLTIPEDMEVLEPLEKKRFEGGVYAARMIRMGNFYEWAWLDRWVQENGEYVYRGSGNPENMFGSLEEHLNYFTLVQEMQEGEPEVLQLDLLIPVIKRKTEK